MLFSGTYKEGRIFSGTYKEGRGTLDQATPRYPATKILSQWSDSGVENVEFARPQKEKTRTLIVGSGYSYVVIHHTVGLTVCDSRT
jgi:hypothetical protein